MSDDRRLDAVGEGDVNDNALPSDASSPDASAPGSIVIDSSQYDDLVRRFGNVDVQSEMVSSLFAHAGPVTAHVAVDGLASVPASVVEAGADRVARATTVADIARNAEVTAARWRELGVFKDVQWNLEPLHVEEGDLAKQHGRDPNVVVRYTVTEARTGWDLGIMTSASAVPELQLKVRNLLHRPYSLSCMLLPSNAAVPSGEFRLSSLLPAFGRRCEYVFGRRVENRLTSNRPCPIADAETVTEARVDMTAGGGLVGVDASNTRSVSFGMQDRSLAVREHAELPAELQALYGSDSKFFWRSTVRSATAVFHEDERLRRLYGLPIGGYVLNSRAEVFCATKAADDGAAGSSSATASDDAATTLRLLNNSFLKYEVQGTKFIQLLPAVVLDLSAAFGAVFSAASVLQACDATNWLSAAGADTPAAVTSCPPLADRLFASWRHVRGFRSLGPTSLDVHRARYPQMPPPKAFRSLGGDCMWACSAVLNAPLPVYPDNGFVGMHLFANAGHVHSFGSARAALRSWRDLFTTDGVAASVGAGLCVTGMPAMFSAIGAGRLEVNVAFPFTLRGGAFAPRRDLFDGSVPGLFERVKWGVHWTSLEG